VKVTGYVAAVVKVVATVKDFAAESPEFHVKEATPVASYVTPAGAALGAIVTLLPPVGALKGVMVTVCAVPPLISTISDVIVHVMRARTLMVIMVEGAL